MSSLLFLTSDDFGLAQNQNTKTLYHEIRGFSLVLFYSTRCPNSRKFLPIFKQLPSIVNGCQFGMINIDNNRRILESSKGTTTHIQYVPLIILYINGYPYMRYDGARTPHDIQAFILKVSNSVQESGFSKTINNRRIPGYTIGQPLYGDDDVTYLEFDEREGYHPRSH